MFAHFLSGKMLIPGLNLRFQILHPEWSKWFQLDLCFIPRPLSSSRVKECLIQSCFRDMTVTRRDRMRRGNYSRFVMSVLESTEQSFDQLYCSSSRDIGVWFLGPGLLHRLLIANFVPKIIQIIRLELCLNALLWFWILLSLFFQIRSYISETNDWT